MNISSLNRVSLVAGLAAALLVVPLQADAQGRGNKGQDKERARPELIRRDDDRRDDRRDRRAIERYEDRRGEADRGPPFCRNGQGHPVHGRQWCVDKGFGLGVSGGIYGTQGRYEDRRDVYGGSGSYERAHQDFHQWHDRECRMRAAERPLDLQWQIRVRSECKQRHDDWHYRAGRAHG